MTKKQKNLEALLFKCIEMILKEPLTENRIEGVPEMAQCLINLWDHFGD
ncbi:MAG: hypothetical protein RR335_10595 [Eubacterium sp.]